MRKLLTAREVAEILDVHVKTVDRWASQGAGPPYYKFEGTRRYDQDELAAWLEARKVPR